MTCWSVTEFLVPVSGSAKRGEALNFQPLGNSELIYTQIKEPRFSQPLGESRFIKVNSRTYPTKIKEKRYGGFDPFGLFYANTYALCFTCGAVIQSFYIFCLFGSDPVSSDLQFFISFVTS